MSLRTKIYTLIVLCCVLLSASALAIEYNYGNWEDFDAIDGIEADDITQTDPDDQTSNRVFLHYGGGTGSAETTTLEIDVSDAEDMDRQKVCSRADSDDPWVFDRWEESDAGLDLDPDTTTWSCKTVGGTLVDNGYTTVFTPGSGIYSGIWIKCKVFDGSSYSDGEEKEITWGSTLTTFKVGVQMDPGPYIVWETDPDRTETLVSSFAGLECAVTRDAYTNGTLLTTPTGTETDNGGITAKVLTWTVIAHTDTGSINGIMGTISHECDITVGDNHLFCSALSGGIADFGTIGTMASSLLGAANPYAGAVVTCAVGSVGSKSNYKWSFLAGSAIENGGDAEIKDEVVNFRGGSQMYESSTFGNLSTLSVTGSANRNLTAAVTKGSFDADSLVQAFDDSAWNYVLAKTLQITDSPATWGATTPVYVPPSP